MSNSMQMDRPQRWDVPFGEKMTDTDVEQLRAIEPFKSMDPTSFPINTPLDGILRNDCRIVDFQDQDIVIREGDYGHSAFLILQGEVLISLKSLPANLLGRASTRKKSFFESIAQLWNNSTIPERRNYVKGQNHQIEESQRIFLQDIPGVLDANKTITLGEGEFFGELAALTRAERSATVLAKGRCRLLEIRWQGLRELLKRASELRQHIEQLYRQNSLRVHFRQTPLLSKVPAAAMDQLVDGTAFESYGNFDWNHKFKDVKNQDVSQRIESEPLIVKEGDYVNGLFLIRNGFARVSQNRGAGHHTIEYLGKGQVFGIPELSHNWNSQNPIPWQHSLRAVGYVDVLRIPTSLVEEHVLPSLSVDELPDTSALLDSSGPTEGNETKPENTDDRLLEFMVEHRFMNGTQAMVIDLDRCTRCDDCVRACAATHDNNPRFIRHGMQFDNYMIANACMHCVDPVCMIGCPTGAIGRDSESGNVTINDQTCIGCSTCANSCPYNNIRMVPIRNSQGDPLVDQEKNEPIVKATKCDLCVEQSGGPACQRACPHDALVRIDLTKPGSFNNWTEKRKS